MFTDISWATYLTVIGSATFAWYSLLAIFQYYGDIKDFLNGKRTAQFNQLYDSFNKPPQAPAEMRNHVTANGTFEEPALQDFEIIEELIDRVKALITEAVERKISKEQFLKKLEAVLKDFPSLQKSQYRPSVNEFITSESDSQGLASITMEEVDGLWNQK